MKATLIFPTILIILDLFAAMVYAHDFNIRLTIYWFAAAILTACVTY